MAKAVALTTVDNPYDPVNDFQHWFMFDNDKGYGTCNYLARIVRDSNQFSEEEHWAAVDQAIDEILKYDFRHIYKKIVY